MKSQRILVRLITVVCVCAMLLPIIASLTVIPSFAVEDPVITDTTCAYLYNITNDRVLYSKNMDLTIYPASTVKIMFAIIAIEQWKKSWDTEITVERHMLSKVSGNNINLRSGEVVTFRDLINCVIVGGANDCAYVIAHSLFEDIQDFVDLMNAKAAELGMTDTNYENITGMHDPDMVTTLSDVVTLAKYALTQYTYIDMTHQYKYIMAATNRSGSRVIYTRNHFMTSAYTNLYYRPDVDGMNAGSTSEAGHCAVVTAENSGTSYLAIAMGSSADGSTIYAFTTIRSMLDWAYENFRYVVVAKDTDVICELPVNMSSSVDHVSVMPKNTVEVFMEGDIDIENDIRRTVVMTSESLTAPVESGKIVGYLTLSHKDEVLARVELVTKTVIPRSEFLYLVSIIYDFIKSRTVVFILIVIAIIGILYVVVKAIVIENKRRIEMRKKALEARKKREQLKYIPENNNNNKF